MSFKSFDLHPAILKAIDKCGYTDPTPIQAEAIPKVLNGNDIIASANTGTGKTAAFVLPVLQRLAKKRYKKQRGQPSVLVLTPTRELANQVTQAIRNYGKNIRVSSVSLVGGMPYGPQLRSLSKPIDIVVATPGRLIDHIENRNIDLSKVSMLILDEADRMLDMGFVDEVNKIADFTPEERQTLLFTATWDGKMASLARSLLNEPKRVAMDEQLTQENIEQRLHVADDVEHKNRLLQHLLDDDDLTQAIIFSATKLGADILARDLKAQGHSAAALHGDMKQAARNRTLQNMRRGKLRLLVATDVAARGIDMTSVSHVINFDIPRFAEDYVHRIGRTGRAGATGTAISFALPSDLLHLERIEKYTGQQVPRLTIPGLEPKRSLERKKKKRKYNSKGYSKSGRSGGYSDPKRKGGGRHLNQPPAHRRRQRASTKKTAA
ncbi:DEAD/DEAH box helicase [Candidatus Halobeggiatoa sp. HSG11]|nr:DEAD/DEAH box helicase [Candidatus Halobeggiatoa sp. HSG11]